MSLSLKTVETAMSFGTERDTRAFAGAFIAGCNITGNKRVQ